MVKKYENVPLRAEIIAMMDVIVNKFGYNSRPELIKDLIRRHIENLLALKVLHPDEINKYLK